MLKKLDEKIWNLFKKYIFTYTFIKLSDAFTQSDLQTRNIAGNLSQSQQYLVCQVYWFIAALD